MPASIASNWLSSVSMARSGARVSAVNSSIDRSTAFGASCLVISTTPPRMACSSTRPNSFFAAVAVTAAPTGATITATDASAAELGDDTATFVISRPAGEPTTADHPVTVTIGGTASPFSDYGSSSGIGNGASFSTAIPAGQPSLTITLTAFFDAVVEGPETVTFTVDGTSATATIVDEPAATLAATDAAASEVGPDAATFVVSRATGASTAYDRPATVTIGGTASPFTDYASSSGIGNGASFGVTIPAGQASATVTVTPIDDFIQETGGETVILTLTADPSYGLGATSTGTVTIADNEVLPTVTITATPRHPVPRASDSRAGRVTERAPSCIPGPCSALTFAMPAAPVARDPADPYASHSSPGALAERPVIVSDTRSEAAIFTRQAGPR